jgi:hypothetical protein
MVTERPAYRAQGRCATVSSEMPLATRRQVTLLVLSAPPIPAVRAARSLLHLLAEQEHDWRAQTLRPTTKPAVLERMIYLGDTDAGSPRERSGPAGVRVLRLLTSVSEHPECRIPGPNRSSRRSYAPRP